MSTFMLFLVYSLNDELEGLASEFEEMYVGVGASRIRKLFKEAKEHVYLMQTRQSLQAPCIIFIDELDAIGGRRTEYGNNYSRMTINQLLTEIGGFKGSQGILVVGATNLKSVLDPALLRPGRFDLEIEGISPSYEFIDQLACRIRKEEKKF